MKKRKKKKNHIKTRQQTYSHGLTMKDLQHIRYSIPFVLLDAVHTQKMKINIENLTASGVDVLPPEELKTKQ